VLNLTTQPHKSELAQKSNRILTEAAKFGPGGGGQADLFQMGEVDDDALWLGGRGVADVIAHKDPPTALPFFSQVDDDLFDLVQFSEGRFPVAGAAIAAVIVAKLLAAGEHDHSFLTTWQDFVDCIKILHGMAPFFG